VKKLLQALLLAALPAMAGAFPGDVAVFIGSFDPIHEGHMAVIRGALPDLGVDHVLVIPTPDTRRKNNHARLEDRLALVRAVAYRFKEVASPGPELAAILREGGREWRPKLLAKLYDRLPPSAVVQEIIGMDVFNDRLRRDLIPSAQEPRMMIVVDRPGYPIDTDLMSKRRMAPGKVLFLHPEVVDVQSADVRDAVARGMDIFGKVPNVVRKLIEARELYR